MVKPRYLFTHGGGYDGMVNLGRGRPAAYLALYDV